jgi:hypothetical protein
MRKIIFLIIMILGAIGLRAQDGLPTYTITPAEIDALTENVTIVFDVTGTVAEGLSDVYIWAWSPDLDPSQMLLCYEQGTADWDNISENAKLDPVEGSPNKFMLSLPKTVTRAGVEVTFNNIAELFGVGDTPGKIKEFGFLLRSQDGNTETPGNMATSISLLALEFESSYFRTFPSKMSNQDVVTAYLNLSLLESGEDERLKIAVNITASISLLTENDTKILTVESLETIYTEQEEYAVSFLPEMLAEFPDGTSIDDVAKCQVVFSGEVYNQEETPVLVNTQTFGFEFQEYE